MNSEKYKETVDDEISDLIADAYSITKVIIEHARCIIEDLAAQLKERRSLDAEEMIEIINTKYPDLIDL
jgi:ATP-dependent Zn protease